MNVDELKNKLQELVDTKYQKFHAALIPGIDNVMGVRMPELRGLAKEICKKVYSDEECKIPKGIEILQTRSDIHEIAMIQALVIGQLKCDTQTKVKMVTKFIPCIYSWAICDCFVSSLKEVKKQPDLYLPLIEKYIGSKNEYEERFSAVMLLAHYVNETYIDNILKLLYTIRGEQYYTKMAVAWAYSVCFVKHPDETYTFLKHNQLESWTLNKTYQKIRESLRCTPQMRQMIKTLETG